MAKGKSKIGRNSLIVSVLGLILLEVSIHLEVLEGVGWRILTTGFEAATIGALADWFAVSALFYEIPIPIIRHHTNIIVKNRDKLTEGIVDMVTNKWLSSEIIREKLADVSPARGLLEQLEHPGNLERSLDIFRVVVLRFSENLDNPKLIIWIHKQLKDQLAGIDLATPLGNWIQELVKEGRHHIVVDILIEEIDRTIKKPETKTLVLLKMKEALTAYEKLDWVKRSTIWLGKKTGGINLDLLADRLLDIAEALITETKADHGHPLRQKMDNYLVEFAKNLKAEEQVSHGFIQDLKRNLLLNDGVKEIIRQLLNGLNGTIQDAMRDNGTAFMGLVRKNIKAFMAELREDPERLSAIDTWIKETLTNLLETYHPEIGNMVRSSLSKLDDRGMMEQIKEKVGDDLQYIRLNGAVVGGMVGICIAVARWLIF